MSQLPEKSFRTATTLAAYRFVAISAGVVAYPANITSPISGVTTDTVQDTTSAIPVALPGSIVKVYFNDTVSAGGLVTSDTSGRAVPYTAISTATWYTGVLVGAAVADTGTIAEVLLMPGQATID